MRKFSLLFCLCAVYCAMLSAADGSSTGTATRRLYQLPENLPPQSDSHLVQNILAGTESGLYKIIGSNTPVPLWTKSRVTQILYTQNLNGEQWFFVTGLGIVTSTDLTTFTILGKANGLPELTLKTYDGEKTPRIRIFWQLLPAMLCI